MSLTPIFELIHTHLHVWRTAWNERRDSISPKRSSTERAFLPAALELLESPPHPAARVTQWTLMAFFLIAVLWAIIGKVDIVATAPGKLVVTQRSKVIQPLEPGVIKAIHVRDGQQVKAGQILVELDGTFADAESDKNKTAWVEARLELARAQALLDALARHGTPVLASDADLDALGDTVRKQRHDTTQLVLSQWQELQSKLSAIDTDTVRKQAERAGTHEQVQKLEQTLPLIAQRANDYKHLSENNFIAKHGYLEKEQARIETERDLASLRNKLEELAQSLNANQRQKESLLAEFKRTQQDNLNAAREKAQELAQEVIKAHQRQRQTRLTAPVNGIVQQLAIHTIGGVVTGAQALMVVVPQEDAAEAEVLLENKDIGFVNAGQDAAIKVETFNYTKYGLINGKVETVSLDAIQDEKRGLIYAARVKLEKSTMNIEGKKVKLVPGMSVTVEIKTGKRRIIEYFLSPLIQHTSESIRER